MNNYPQVTEAEQEELVREAWTNYGTDNPAQWQSFGTLDNYVKAQVEKYFPLVKRPDIRQVGR